MEMHSHTKETTVSVNSVSDSKGNGYTSEFEPKPAVQAYSDSNATDASTLRVSTMIRVDCCTALTATSVSSPSFNC